MKAWIKKKEQTETEAYHYIVIASNPETTANSPHVRIDATCPCCKEHLDIIFPKATVKALSKMFKTSVSDSAKQALVKPFSGHPRTNERPRFKRVIK